MIRPDLCPECGASCTHHTGTYCHECGTDLVPQSRQRSINFTITERQLRALENVLRIESSVGARLSTGEDYLTPMEMADLHRRFHHALSPLTDSAVGISVEGLTS